MDKLSQFGRKKSQKAKIEKFDNNFQNYLTRGNRHPEFRKSLLFSEILNTRWPKIGKSAQNWQKFGMIIATGTNTFFYFFMDAYC